MQRQKRSRTFRAVVVRADQLLTSRVTLIDRIIVSSCDARGLRVLAVFNSVRRLHHQNIFTFNMLEAKSPPLLLFVGALLMASCQSRKHAAEQGRK